MGARAAIGDSNKLGGAIVREVPEPGRPGRGEIRVRMLYAPVNPADLLTQGCRYAGFGDRPPVLGAEGVGVIEETGEGVPHSLTSCRVIPLSRGNWSSHRILSVCDFVVVPQFLDDRHTAVLRINPATAARLLEALSLQRGELLVHNASRSSVIRWIQLLALQACIDTCPVEAAAHASAHGALDAVAGTATGKLAAKLAPEGRLIVYGHISGDPCSIPSTLITGRGLAIGGFSLRRAEADQDIVDLSPFTPGLPKPCAPIPNLSHPCTR